MPKLINNSKNNIDNVLSNFLDFCTEKDLTLKTKLSYRSSILLFTTYLEEQHNITTVNKITTQLIKDYLEETRTRGKYTFISSSSCTNNNPSARVDFNKQVSSVTVNNYLRNIKVFLQFCTDTQLIKFNVAASIKQTKTKHIQKEDITDSDFKLLLRVINIQTFSGFRDFTLFQLLLDTGMRITETLNLTVQDINLANNTIFLSATITKGRKDRIVYFGSKMQVILRKWLKFKDSYFNTNLLFPSQRCNLIKCSATESNLRKYLRDANITKQISCHTFRNNFAKRYLASGGSIYILSQLLGHSSVVVTEQAYADLLQQDIKKNYISPLSSM